jgi:hypothetical protein
MFEGRRLVMVLIPPAGPPVTLPLGWLLPGGLVSLDPGIQVYYYPVRYIISLDSGNSVSLT